MTPRTLLMIAAASGLLAVALGAFGAHGLKSVVSADLLGVYQTGVQYQFYHTLALAFTGLLWLQFPKAGLLGWAGALFTLGMVLFSGSLYALVLLGTRGIGLITPLGGLAFMVGWLLLLLAISRQVR